MIFTKDYFQGKKLRYERKYVVPSVMKDEVCTYIKRHSLFFYECYPERKVNSIYCDTFCLNDYYENLKGSSERIKTRFRWYGEEMVSDVTPCLEFKIKKNELGTKRIYRLGICNFSDLVNSKCRNERLHEANVPPELIMYLSNRFHNILISYSRKYFQSMNNIFRITIDSDITYYNITQNGRAVVKKKCPNNDLVIEFKYLAMHDEYARSFESILPYRYIRNSKYINSVNVLYL